MTSPPDRRLRVLQCITRLGLGGSERVALSLVRAFGREIESGVFAVHGVAGDAVGQAMRDELERAGVPWFKGTAVPMKAGGMIPAAVALRRVVARFRPDILHVHSETPEACVAMARALSPAVRQVPVVRTIHNSIFWRYWPRIGRWCDHRLATAHVAAVSGGALEEFMRYRADSGAARPPVPPVVIHNGIDLPVRPAHARPADPSRRRVLFAGRFEWQKGVDLIPDFLPRVSLPSGVVGQLDLIGSGAFEPQLRALANRPPPGWTLELQPPVPALPSVFPHYDLVLMPSRFEGLALTAIEATFCGRPIVATDVPGLRDTLPAGHPWLPRGEDAAAIATSLSDALASVERWGAAVGAAQRFAVDHFSSRAMVEGYRSFYARLRPAPVNSADTSESPRVST